MKKVFLVPSVLMLCVSVQAQTKKTTKMGVKPKSTATTGTASLKTSNDSVSYAFGLSLGQYLKSQGISAVNFSMLNKAIDQTIKGQPTLLDMTQANHVM